MWSCDVNIATAFVFSVWLASQQITVLINICTCWDVVNLHVEDFFNVK